MEKDERGKKAMEKKSRTITLLKKRRYGKNKYYGNKSDVFAYEERNKDSRSEKEIGKAYVLLSYYMA